MYEPLQDNLSAVGHCDITTLRPGRRGSSALVRI